MFCFFLGLNAWTDYREGFIYDGLSVLLLLTAILEGVPWRSGYLWGSLLCLVSLWVWDRREEYLGRGDYLILVSVCMHLDWQLPLALLATSVPALIYLGLTRQRRIPLIPFLFLGTAATELLI